MKLGQKVYITEYYIKAKAVNFGELSQEDKDDLLEGGILKRPAVQIVGCLSEGIIVGKRSIVTSRDFILKDDHETWEQVAYEPLEVTFSHLEPVYLVATNLTTIRRVPEKAIQIIE
ncbi:hypothetical protein HF072_07250 [Bacillus sp. RO3]|nr:hypothetical protein [Bacillus sp. RO3]